ncbi:MAG TPA: hypothetical protein VFP97_04515 [Chitinophagaceae bacterium]|nr:hypothetical protein [Chitinophagaceae bacterium]
MKKLIICLCLFATIGALAAKPPEVNEKVLKAFKETFIRATDVVWHEMQNSYEAHFKQSEIVTRAIYDTQGNLLRTTRYYSEEYLPINILSKLKKKYADKSVFGVTELSLEDVVSYHITLEDEKNWYIVIADNWGSFDLSKKFRKA